MKRISLSLFVLALAVLSLTVIVPGLPPLLGMQAVARAATETTFAFDVAVDCRTFSYNRGIPLDQIVRGDGFIVNARIFPAGALPSGPQTNDPSGPGSIGTLVACGTTTGSLAEHLANPQAPGVFWTQYLLLNDGRGLVSEGWMAPSGANRATVVGGMGAFRGASGESAIVNIGTNSTGCPNSRLTITIEKQTPK